MFTKTSKPPEAAGKPEKKGGMGDTNNNVSQQRNRNNGKRGGCWGGGGERNRVTTTSHSIPSLAQHPLPPPLARSNRYPVPPLMRSGFSSQFTTSECYSSPSTSRLPERFDYRQRRPPPPFGVTSRGGNGGGGSRGGYVPPMTSGSIQQQQQNGQYRRNNERTRGRPARQPPNNGFTQNRNSRPPNAAHMIELNNQLRMFSYGTDDMYEEGPPTPPPSPPRQPSPPPMPRAPVVAEPQKKKAPELPPGRMYHFRVEKVYDEHGNQIKEEETASIIDTEGDELHFVTLMEDLAF